MSTKKKRLLLGSVLTALALHLPYSMAQTATASSNSTMEQPVSIPSPADLEVNPGECWVYGQIKPRAIEKTVAVTVKDSHTTIEVTPAEIKRGYKQVVTREGTVTYRLQPATYKRVTEQVLVRPETTRFVKVPAVYEERQKRVVVEEARTVIEQCSSFGGAAAFCAKEIPAKEQWVKVQVLVQPEQSKVEVVPAKYETVTKWVVDQPARVVEVSLAPKLEEVPVDEVVKPASANPRQVPAQTRQMQLKSYSGKPKMVMRRAVCNDDLSSNLILSLQQRLSDIGYQPGPVDGMLGEKTIQALQVFQGENGLAVGAITFESLDSLGIHYNQ
ncbi:peptidoglycan-binding domain-containing protein [Marinomonas ostreistagni]|uniref:Peptidoglycan-binding protein n=1 Tax=Marinomonas ostreistagni TaxID=359209 RepID=A0ABS0ZCW2_9GAMM|nr:peptidoglycan-binding domain-containing protein [Marinomonas ostreistagni]MBJ7551474.1 peptidoglycan-binding protein [Marinomonas ostreistagni]